jgi:hypothetical protein
VSIIPAAAIAAAARGRARGGITVRDYRGHLRERGARDLRAIAGDTGHGDVDAWMRECAVRIARPSPRASLTLHTGDLIGRRATTLIHRHILDADFAQAINDLDGGSINGDCRTIGRQVRSQPVG